MAAQGGVESHSPQVQGPGTLTLDGERCVSSPGVPDHLHLGDGGAGPWRVMASWSPLCITERIKKMADPASETACSALSDRTQVWSDDVRAGRSGVQQVICQPVESLSWCKEHVSPLLSPWGTRKDLAHIAFRPLSRSC